MLDANLSSNNFFRSQHFVPFLKVCVSIEKIHFVPCYLTISPLLATFNQTFILRPLLPESTKGMKIIITDLITVLIIALTKFKVDSMAKQLAN